MEGVRGQYALPGEFRTTQNWIGAPGQLLSEATFVPPPVDQMKKALGDWEEYLHTPDDAPSLIRLAFVHYQFEAIHPFVDGNGRIGRLLISLLMQHWELLPQPLLYLSAFFERHRSDYYRGLLRVSQRGAWENWVEFFLLGVRQQAREALEMAVALVALRKEFQARLQGRRRTRVTEAILDGLFQNPAVTTRRVQQQYGISFNTARKAIGDLEEAGILQEITGRRSGRIWLAAGILDAIKGRTRSGESGGG
jgi:Fic family protein